MGGHCVAPACTGSTAQLESRDAQSGGYNYSANNVNAMTVDTADNLVGWLGIWAAKIRRW